VNYIVVAKLTGMRAHTAHDNDPAFKAWDGQLVESVTQPRPF